MNGLSRRLIVGSIALAVLLHIWIVASILGQPFDVQKAAPESRSVVWALSNDSAHLLGPFGDFFAVYNAGLCARAGQGFYAKNCYPPAPYLFLFRYLPVVGYTLGYGLSSLPPREAAILWALLLEGLLTVFLLLFWRTVGHPWVRLFAVAVLLLSTPYFLELHMGQFTFGTLVLTAIAILLLEGAERPGETQVRSLTRGEILAVLCFTAAVLTKLFPLVVAPALLRRGRAGWACVLTAVGALLLCNAPYFLQHPGTWQQYLDRNFSLASVWQSLNPGNFGLVYLIHIGIRDLGLLWSDGGWVAFVQVWRTLILAPIALLVLFSRRRDLVLGSSVLVLAHFATFHHVWEHHWSGALPIGLLILWRAAEPDGKTSEAVDARRLLGVSLALLFWAMPTPSLLFDKWFCPPRLNPIDTWPEWAKILTPAFKVVPMVVLLVWLLPPFWRAGFGWPWTGWLPRGRTAARAALPLLLALALALCPRSAVAGGPGNFLDLEFGRSMPAASDLEIDQPGLGTALRVHGLAFRDDSFVDPPWYCVRLGRWEARPSWLGFAIAFLHPKLFARVEEQKRVSGLHANASVDRIQPVDSLLQAFSISHGESRLSFEMLFRHGFLEQTQASAVRPPVPSSGYPDKLRPAGPSLPGRDLLELFAGIGLGPVIAHPESLIDEQKGKERYQLAGLGYEGFAGLRILPWSHTGILLEYKYTAADLKVDVYKGSARLKERTSHVSGGITYTP